VSQYIQFGSGLLFVNPNGADQAADPTPIRPLTLQDMSIDISVDVKELRGQNQFADDVAPADKKGTGKFTFGRVDIELFNQMFFADTSTPGGVEVPAPLEAHAIPAATAFTIDVNNKTAFTTDYGVSFASGLELKRVGANPATGQYSVAAGTYTFAAADAGKAVVISYSYSGVTNGSTLTVNNQIQGYGPQVELYFVHNYKKNAGVPSAVKLFAARITKLNLAMKRTDYVTPEADFSFFQNATGQVMEFYSAF
jgi:hypothetical protein